MITPASILLYVADPAVSARFYAARLGREPIEQSPTFALFALADGIMLGLWRRDGVVPAPCGPGADSEIGFSVATPALVDATHAAWQAQAVPMALPPTDLDFGRSFVALDPDGHRLRVYALADAT